jgi:predicted transcriptional regulator of viral defense system
LSFANLQRLVAAGTVERVARGLYRKTGVEPDALESVAMACARSPHAIVCLFSALAVHGLTTQMPRDVWLGLDRKARRPVPNDVSLRVVRFSGAMLTYGIVSTSLLGVPARVTSPARTVVDCFRYRNRIGLDVALEALRDAVRTRTVTVDEITRAAEVCRARTLVKPYLEALE